MSRRAATRPLLAVTVAGALTAGCVPSLEGNVAREPNRKVPASYSAGAATAGPAAPSGPRLAWGELFPSPDLRSLVETALRNNQELNVRLQEIIIAQSEVSARRGEYLPKVSAGVGAGLEKPGHTSQGVSDEAHGLPDNLGSFQFGLTGAWEIDVWNKLRSATAAADLRYRATVEARAFLVTQILAELARSYYELVALDNAVEIVRRNIDIQASALEVVKLEKLAARTTELAVQRFEAEVLKNRSRLYDLEQERVQLENRINFLVGRYPQPVARKAAELDTPLPEHVRTGLPADLLTNRPDVRQAELELEAAKLDVKVAKAGFYPSFSIDAEAGYRSFNATHLVSTPESMMYSLAGHLTAPLLNRAAITAQYRSANARQLQAVFGYERTVLQAFTDVANQLAMIGNLQKSYELEAQQVEKLGSAVEVSNILFRAARADYMEVLLTRRDSLDAQLELLETKKRQLLALVNVYQALGGGWDPGQTPAAPP